jgi:metal-responsive CopG/Arc/MetJ family transcriptional regulator
MMSKMSRYQVYKIGRTEGGMATRTIVLKLNQQQLELLDRTVAKGAAADRKSLIRRAIREHAGRHGK